MVSIMPYVSRIAKAYPGFVLGTGNEAFSKVLKESLKNRAANNQTYWQAFKSGSKNGFKAVEAHNAKMVARHNGSFWKATWDAIKTTPNVIKAGWRLGGIKAAGKSGLTKFFSQFKGALKGVGKRMPLLGTLLIAGDALTNVFSAFMDKGLAGGTIEAGKSAVRLGAATTGAAIGSAILSPIPVVGPLVGCIAGWALGEGVANIFVGKSHREKKAEQKALAMANQNVPFMGGGMQPTLTPEQITALAQQLYGGGLTNPAEEDFMQLAASNQKIDYKV